MIAKFRGRYRVCGIDGYVVSIASLFRIGRQGEHDAGNFESTLANCVARFT